MGVRGNGEEGSIEMMKMCVETPPPSRGGRGIPADNTAAGLDLASCGRTPDPTYGAPWARLSPKKHIIRRVE